MIAVAASLGFVLGFVCAGVLSSARDRREAKERYYLALARWVDAQ